MKIPIRKKSFIKFSPLLDPYRYMIGNMMSTMTALKHAFINSDEQLYILNYAHHNASYIDSFFLFN